ncbi:FK506-binding protein 5 isoform X2 [Bicyclus anynana]|uniref:FK506-binding protein 5 isoform X2 n=1 Tax=Bicyclus anynana TaxID=110368 RepID=A0ABM3LZH7_BICAN|nr:FK506-binding protein 5 isoform X2 [Bicyclus anynana]
MNPPSALYGAMNKERKPFTYTPGGLDLTEIKSERMAQRLMRNAMNQGLPETQIQTVQSPPVQFNHSAIPNFNCLPVQVFPTFALPANPKSLLRSRSNPDPPKELPINKTPAPSLFISDNKDRDQDKVVNKPSLLSLNNNGSVSTNDSKCISNTSSLFQPASYIPDSRAEITLPEKSFDAEYFILEPHGNIKLTGNEINKIEDNYKPVSNIFGDTAFNIEKDPEPLASPASQERTANDTEQKVKVIKKQTKTSENEAEQNGDTEAAIVVKLPSKKSSAKTETKVEVLKKILPDGSIEEVKTTTTKTTIDGKTEIKKETETRILPKEEDNDTVEIEEEEEEENEDVVIEENEVEQNDDEELESNTNVNSKDESKEEMQNELEIKENGHIISGEEKVEISTTKKVVITQSTDQESEKEQEEEEEEEEEEEIQDGDVEVEQVIVLKKVNESKLDKNDQNDSDDVEEINVDKEIEGAEEEEEEVIEEENVEEEQESATQEIKKDAQDADEDKEVEVEKAEAEEVEAEEVEAEEVEAEEVEGEEIETEEIDAENEPNEVEVEKQEEDKDLPQENNTTTISSKENDKLDQEEAENEEGEKQDKNEEENVDLSTTAPIQEESLPDNQNTTVSKDDSPKQEPKDEQERLVKITLEQKEPKVSFREPSVPLEKVEDVEIKPIGPAQEIIKKCHTEIITTTKDEPTGALSTQTNYNRIENIVTVNRTTKTLDHSYEPELNIPAAVKPFYVPPNDRILSTPQPISRPYQPVYTPEPQTERRHSLLLDRLSIERQIPIQQSDIYQNNYQYSNQNYEQNQWSQEPQSEVLTVSNVKPSTITKNQQWYQQSKREENITSNIVTPTPIMPSQLSQPQTQPQVQTQPQYQNYVQPQYTPKPEPQPTYTDFSKQNSFKSTNLQQNTYPTYTPKPSWVSSTFDSKPTPAANQYTTYDSKPAPAATQYNSAYDSKPTPASTQYNQYSTTKKESNESYQTSTQPFSSSYVPPPWEQDSSYIAGNQCYYEPPPPTTYTPSPNPSWKPTQPASKFTKPKPTSYIPPAPNQSFVKPVSSSDLNVLPGRKTYYSEYERRYISVPESTYIPTETKYQAQPDPSPQFYYDNNEPVEPVEPQWRKELREFTEKTSQTTITQTEKTSVKPPWEEDPKYATGYTNTSTVTPSWTQTLRPRSWRERSYETEYIGSKEWPKTNTLGRGRPHSSYVRNNVDTIRERTRGVSVDRYNPNSYQPPLPSEHPPVQSHTLTQSIHPKAYHNPSVPAYHSRTSAESREQTTPYIQRTWSESKAPPVQSRSFKYLQWITGTED